MELLMQSKAGITALIVVVLACVGAALPGTAGAATACAKKGSKTVAASERARIYTQKGTGQEKGSVLYFGCWYSNERRTKIYTAGDPDVDHAGTFRLAEKFVGFETETADPTGGESDASVQVFNLKTGKRVASELVGDNNATFHSVTALVVKANGSFGWIEAATAASQVNRRVKARDKSGLRLLDDGTDIRPDSLALAGSTLYWTRGGAPRSASLN
jgi:hypothetical protein